MKIVWFFILCNLVLVNFAAAQDDDDPKMGSRDSVIYAWEIDDFLNKRKVPVDTFLNDIHVINPLNANYKFNAYTGNTGAPAYSLYFFNRYENQDFIFLSPFAPYLKKPDNCRYYNTRNPFSEINYSTNLSVKDKLSQQVSFFHTQNVNEKLNGGFDYDLISSEGQYARQKHKIGNFSLFSSYNSEHYHSYTNLNINNLTLSQNGGVELNEFYEQIKDSKAYTTNFSEAESGLRNRNFFTTHSYKFGAVNNDSVDYQVLIDSLLVDTSFCDSNIIAGDMIAPVISDTTKLKDSIAAKLPEKEIIYRHNITYKFNYQDDFMRFTDANPTDASDGFYDTIFETDQTYDSVAFRSIKNAIGYQFLINPNLNLNTGVFINNDLRKYYFRTHNKYSVQQNENDTMFSSSENYFIVNYNNDTLYDLYDKKYMNNTSLSYYIDQNKNNYKWYARANYYLFGYYKNNYSLSGLWWNHMSLGNDSLGITLSGDFVFRKPDYLYQQYSSNHIKWDNSFKNYTNTSLKFKFDDYSRNVGLAIEYAMTYNYIYFDTLYTPRQYEKPASVLGLSCYKNLYFWKIRSHNRLSLQETDSDHILHIPSLCFFNSTYLFHTINFESTGGRIDLQFGFDFYYNSDYYIHQYMPAINQFYLQDMQKFGNYPYLDVFLNFKVQRARIFVKYCHANYNLMQDRYFKVYSYPMNEPVFRIGFYWSFYN